MSSINLETEERIVLTKHLCNPGSWDHDSGDDRIAAILYVWKTRLDEGDDEKGADA